MNCGSVTSMGHGEGARCGAMYYDEIYVCDACRIKSLEADAERYRWLRNADNWSEEGPTPVVATCESTMYGDELDRTIDAAIAKEKA